MNTIRLTITPEIREVLDTIQSKYPPLSEPEILKVALSELYIKTTQSSLQTINIEELNQKGRNIFSVWLKKQNKKISDMSEDEAYDLIQNA